MSEAELQERFSSLVKENSRKERYSKILYKYRGIYDKEEKKLNEDTKRIITSNEIFFPNPLQFNDPFDFKLPINLVESTKNFKKEDFVFYLNHLKEDLKKENNNILKEDLPNIKIVLNSGKIESIAKRLLDAVSDIEEKVYNEFNKIGVCCFSKKDNNILMWSHYAQAHKGICFKFDRTEDSDFFSPLVNVKYKKEVDTDITKYFLEYYKFERDSFKTKYSDWSYENEVRIIKNGFQKIIMIGDLENLNLTL